MRYYLDTEFQDGGRLGPENLISLAIVSEDGRELYLCNKDATSYVDDWVKANVLPQLPPRDSPRWVWAQSMPTLVAQFVAEPKAEFWGYYADYDWVLLSMLFGGMLRMPENFPQFCRDLKQFQWALGAPEFPAPDGEHDALVDARWNRELHARLVTYEASKFLRGL